MPFKAKLHRSLSDDGGCVYVLDLRTVQAYDYQWPHFLKWLQLFLRDVTVLDGDMRIIRFESADDLHILLHGLSQGLSDMVKPTTLMLTDEPYAADRLEER